jgi:ketosteroid isomerase-like protein
VSRQDIDVVRRAYAAFAERDAEAIAALADPEVEFLAPHTGALVREGQPYRGWEGLRRYIEDVAALWQEMQAIPQEFREIDDSIVVLGRVYARGKDGLLVDSPVGWVWRLREGKIVWGRGYESHEAALEAVAPGE